MSAPLVRTRTGAVLGVDWRQTKHSEVTVPGWIESKFVMPGDTIREHGMYITVETVRPETRGPLEIVHLIGQTVKGAPMTFEHEAEDLVHVTDMGAFEPAVTRG